MQSVLGIYPHQLTQLNMTREQYTSNFTPLTPDTLQLISMILSAIPHEERDEEVHYTVRRGLQINPNRRVRRRRRRIR